MPFGLNSPLVNKVSEGGTGGQNLLPFWVGLDLIDHEIFSFFSIRESEAKLSLLWAGMVVNISEDSVIFRVLCLVFSLIDKAGDGLRRVIVEMISGLLEIVRNPASVDNDSTLFALLVQVGVKWRQNVKSFFVVSI